MITRQRILIIILVVFLILPLVAFGLFLAFAPKDAPIQVATTLTDRDTGEKVTQDPNKSPENDGSTSVTILGLTEIVNIIPSSYQFNYIREQIGIYSESKLKNKYPTLTLMPQYLEKTDNSIKTKLRLGQGDDIVPITITFGYDPIKTQVIIADPDNRYGGEFQSEALLYSEL